MTPIVDTILEVQREWMAHVNQPDGRCGYRKAFAETQLEPIAIRARCHGKREDSDALAAQAAKRLWQALKPSMTRAKDTVCVFSPRRLKASQAGG